MKLHQIVISGNQDEVYPNGYSYRDFNISTAPYFQFVRKGLGRGKDFFEIKKLNINLYSEINASTELENFPIDKGFISTIAEGGFDFEEYFSFNNVDKVIRLTNVTKNVVLRISNDSAESNTILNILDKIIEIVPSKEAEVDKYIIELNQMMKNQSLGL